MGIQQIGEGGVALEMWACGFRARCTVPRVAILPS